MNLCTDTDDTSFVKVLECVIADVGDVSCNLFRSELCISGLCFVFFNVD